MSDKPTLQHADEYWMERCMAAESKLEAYRLALSDIAELHNQFGSIDRPTHAIMANIGNIARDALK